MTSAMTWISLSAAIVAIVVGVTTMINFGVSRRKAAMEQGQKQQQFVQLQKDLEKAFEKIRVLESSNREGEKALVEIKTMLENIEKTLDKLSEKFDRHCEQGE